LARTSLKDKLSQAPKDDYFNAESTNTDNKNITNTDTSTKHSTKISTNTITKIRKSKQVQQRAYYIDKDLIKEIEELSKKYDADKSTIVNEALRYYFEHIK